MARAEARRARRQCSRRECSRRRCLGGFESSARGALAGATALRSYFAKFDNSVLPVRCVPAPSSLPPASPDTVNPSEISSCVISKRFSSELISVTILMFFVRCRRRHGYCQISCQLLAHMPDILEHPISIGRLNRSNTGQLIAPVIFFYRSRT